jgi:murein DD-endopeptidase MepM/ murein hydrolase activator NlpD
MAMRLTDRVFAKSRGTPEQVVAFAKRNGAERLDFLEAWAKETYRLCALAGMDASLPVAQSHLETGGWKNNAHWRNGNPASMGIPSDPNYIEEHYFPTGEVAAQAQVVHLAVYATGDVPLSLRPYQQADFRLDDYRAAFGNRAVARTIDEFGGGKWAEDPRYSEKWVERGNLVFPNLPDQGAGTPPPQPGGRKITWRDIAPSRSAQLRITQPWNNPNPNYAYGWRYGMANGRHVGLDVGMPRGTEIVALVNGVVEEVALLAPYYRPNYVVVRRPNGHRVLHAHLWTVTVKEGQAVRWDTPIGTSGEQTIAIKDRNGNPIGATMDPDGTGPHWHGEVWIPDARYDSGYRAVDPATYDYGTTDQGGGGDVEPKPKPGQYSTNVPGLPGGPLVTDYPIRIVEEHGAKFVPTKYIPDVKALSPRRSVQHGTGNPRNASAWNEALYFVHGAPDENGVPRKVSTHVVADHTGIMVALPLDRQGVHAGDAFGNQHGYACEMIEASSTWDNPVSRDAVIRIAADFMGRCAARLGVEQPNRHSDYGNPNCPAKLQTVTIAGTSAWNVYVLRWQAARSDELRRMQGEQPPKPKPPKPEPPKPEPPKPEPPLPPDDSEDEWAHER